ncbi:MAG TPA: hypothetical protein VHB27_03495 [Rhodopila sp.]|uniref:tetratricopeptide repeat protein n=1 Tax=Rhodopila sp. TaxID=2480087 RepID=UPI002BF16E3B|nr:hypothetical protein [Rhodopila sp.]HVY14267.1 hypothetical protein [Rhodopila sp.]
MDRTGSDANPIAPTTNDLYQELVPVRRLSMPASALLEPPRTRYADEERRIAEEPAAGPMAKAVPAPNDAGIPGGPSEGARSGDAQSLGESSPSEPPSGEPPSREPAEEPNRDAAAAAMPAGAEPARAETPPTTPPPQHAFKVPPVRWDTLHAMGQLAVQQGDPALATDWYRLTRLAFPDVFHGYTDGAAALAQLGRFDEGRQLLNEASARFPQEPGIPVSWALLEARAGNPDIAIEHWRAALAYPTGAWWIALRLAEALDSRSRHDEADAVLTQAMAVPHLRHPGLLARAVSVAAQRGDWPAVTERLMALGETAPEELLAIDLDRILVALRDADPARLATVLQASWVEPVTDSRQTAPYRLINQARLSQLSGRLATAMARLATLRQLMPPTATPYLRVESILRDAGSSAAADTLLAEAMERLPQEPDLWLRTGDRVEARGDWQGAVTHWTAMSRQFPDNAYPGYRLQQALLRLRDQALDADPADEPARISVADARMTELAFAFESLGGTGFAGGCEFGGVQRAWGAEPLGLFRWATVPPKTLIACLQERFAGIGDEATTDLAQSDESSVLLWEIQDGRYGYEMHSFIPVAQMDRDQMMRTACKRMRYLAAKLLRDLEHPAKIFVHKLASRRWEPAEIEALSGAMAQFPGMRLVCVCLADADHPAGEVETVAPGLIMASMDFSTGHDWAPRTPAWEALCRRVLAEWQPAEPVAAAV